MTSPKMVHGPTVKRCEELEVGDIGNFGSTDELEDHEKHCSEPATLFCYACGRQLCGSTMIFCSGTVTLRELSEDTTPGEHDFFRLESCEKLQFPLDKIRKPPIIHGSYGFVGFR